MNNEVADQAHFASGRPLMIPRLEMLLAHSCRKQIPRPLGALNRATISLVGVYIA
jgi:hypothetical protein